MGGRSSSSGMGSSLSKLGLKREVSVDVDRFDFFDSRFGRYAYDLAEEMDEFHGDSLLVSFTSGNHKAYASIDTESDTLEGIVSDGGGVGTKLLGKVLQYQQDRGRGLMWYADNAQSIRYYDSMGFGKFGGGSSKSKLYKIGPGSMKTAIGIIKKK